MTTLSAHDPQRVADLRHALANTLADEGAITSPGWREAFGTVSRHLFTPRFFLHADEGGYRAVDSTDPEWLAAVYSDRTLVTQLDGDDSAWHRIRQAGPTRGRPSSSSTQPRLMAWMLHALDARPGMRVLEVGTGTGYNAALLAHLLGQDCVVTIDVDEAVTERARRALVTAGYRPTVEVADGIQGFPPAAPYDRVIATCSFPQVPSAWAEQTKPGGKILTHLYTEFDAGGLILLTVGGAGSASGRFLPEYGAFMPMRGYPAPDTLALLQHALRADDDGECTSTTLAASELTGADFPLFAALRTSGVAMHWFQPEGAPGMLTWLLARDSSWAYQTLADDGLIAVQAGPRRLWDELEEHHHAWRAAGSPTRDRLGITITPGADKHQIWIDTPDTPG
ncbi:MAG: ATP-grasp peptide maturase system methyltransferase [Pseudonocardiaceae bacterium]